MRITVSLLLFTSIACRSMSPLSPSKDSGKTNVAGENADPSTASSPDADPDGNPSNSPQLPLPPPGPPGCGLTQAAFCDTFDTPSPGGRGGDLDEKNWSVARISTVAFQDELNAFPATTTQACGKVTPNVEPAGEMFFCASNSEPGAMKFNDSYNDLGGFTLHSYRVRKPFDFSNRTGVIAFDVDAVASLPGGHGPWINVFIASEPIPAPYQSGGALALFAKEGLVLEFKSTSCSIDFSSNSLTHIVMEENYQDVKHFSVDEDCFKTADEVSNHIEIHISQDRLEVWVADAGKPETLRIVQTLDKAHDGFSMPFTRGYVSFQHGRYNASKDTFIPSNCNPFLFGGNGTCPCGECVLLPPYKTYHWDNLAFDGPQLPTPRSYEIPDLVRQNKDYPYTSDYRYFMGPGVPPRDEIGQPLFPNVHQLGYKLMPDGMHAGNGPIVPVTLRGVDLQNATKAWLTMNVWNFGPTNTIGHRLNGGTWRIFDHPFPDGDGGARALAIPVLLSDLKQGDNTIEISGDPKNFGFGIPMANAELTIDVNQ
jgi:hypothetical protein